MKIYEIKLQTTLVREDGPAVRLATPEAVVAYMADAFAEYPEQEQLWAILLNIKNFPKGRQLITLGTAAEALAHPREVFRAAILASASAVVCCHNHPSGDPMPSNNDAVMTQQLREAGKTLGIQLLDRVIVGDAPSGPLGKGFYSFRNAGLI